MSTDKFMDAKKEYKRWLENCMEVQPIDKDVIDELKSMQMKLSKMLFTVTWHSAQAACAV